MFIEYTEQGFDKVLKAMDKMPRSMRNKALRPALRKGAQVVRARAAANVKQVATQGYATGLLSRSIVVRQMRTRNGVLRVAVTIAPQKVSRKGVRVGLYGSVLEHGKSDQRPAPWLRPAAKQSQGQAYSVIKAEASRNLVISIEDAKR